MTDEELIAAGKILCESYFIGCGYSQYYGDTEAKKVTSTESAWAQQAKALADMGHPILGGVPNVTGQTITGPALLRQAEQLGENVRVTREAVEKQPEHNRKALAQWRFAENCFFGTTHKRGLIPDLKDAGPSAY